MNLEQYTGERILEVLATAEEKEIYQVNWEQLHINYGDNVEWQRLKKQILLCDATRDYLYKAPKFIKYQIGARPCLEQVVEKVIQKCITEREKVLALLVYCRDLYKTHDEQLFYGGTEEELIKKGENLCECMGRLMVSLCEICGFPGRIVMQVVGGHIVCEIFLEGGWAYFDPRCGMFYLDENDKFLSIDELVKNPKYILEQKDWVRQFVSAKWTYNQRMVRNYNLLFSKKEIQCFCDYSLMDAAEYNYNWKSLKSAERDGLFVINKRYDELAELIFDT